MACKGNYTLDMLMQVNVVGFQPWGPQYDVLCADCWPKQPENTHIEGNDTDTKFTEFSQFACLFNSRRQAQLQKIHNRLPLRVEAPSRAHPHWRKWELQCLQWIFQFCLFVFTGCRVGFELPVHCKFLVGLTLLMWMVFLLCCSDQLSSELHNFFSKVSSNSED